MYWNALEHISIPLDDDEPMPMYTPAAVGTVVLVPDPAHEMGPHVIALVFRVELFNVRDAEAFPLTSILRSLLVELYVILHL